MRIVACAVPVVFAALAVGSTSTARASRLHAQVRYDACPTTAELDLSSYYPIEAVVAAARSRMPHNVAGINNAQGRQRSVSR